MPKYEVMLHHNVSHAYLVTVEADNKEQAEEKAVALWYEDGGAKCTRSEEDDYQGDLNVETCKEISDHVYKGE